MKLLFVGVLSLVAGFFLGRFFQTTPSGEATARPANPASAAVGLLSSTAPDSAAFASTARTESVAPVPLGSQRAETLRWLAEAGYRSHLNVFSGSQVNPTLIRLLDLRADETARLTAARARAKQEIAATRATGAKSSLSPDGSHLIVEMPALDPALSGPVYDRFVAELEATIGPDRLGLFRQLAGESVERDLDRFGLNGVRYEVDLRTTPQQQNEGFFDFKKSYRDATGTESGSSTGQYSLAKLREEYPDVARFLPPSP